MKKKIFSLCLILIFVISIVSIPKAHALPQDEGDTWYNRMLLVGNTNNDQGLYFLVSAYEYSKQTAWRFYDYKNGELFQFDYLKFGTYEDTVAGYLNNNIISEIGFGASNDGTYYLINLWKYANLYGISFLPDTMGACTYAGSYEMYNRNGVVLINSHSFTGLRKNGLSINDILYLSVATYGRYYEDFLNDINIEDIEQESWQKGVNYGVEYAYRHGFDPFYPTLQTTNGGSYSYKLGNEIGQQTNFNGFQLILGFIFSALGAFGNIEIVPGLKLWYICGIIIVFGLIGFITSRGKRG